MMRKIGYLLVLIFVTSYSSICFGGDLSLGIGYQYFSMKYDFDILSTEGRFVTGSGVKAYAGRGYWNFHRSDRLKGFTGFEFGHIKFNTLDTKGSGNEFGLFIGGEYFMTRNISVLMDFVPTIISLRDSSYSDIKVSGIEYVLI